VTEVLKFRFVHVAEEEEKVLVLERQRGCTAAHAHLQLGNKGVLSNL